MCVHLYAVTSIHAVPAPAPAPIPVLVYLRIQLLKPPVKSHTHTQSQSQSSSSVAPISHLGLRPLLIEFRGAFPIQMENGQMNTTWVDKVMWD